MKGHAKAISQRLAVCTGLLCGIYLGGCALFGISSNGAPNPETALVIHEVRIDQPGEDRDEYFELMGPPGMALSGLAYLVIGDGPGGSGVIEHMSALDGLAIPPSGYFVVAESTFSLGAADWVTSLNFENDDNVTHLLVEGFRGALGQDLDENDDGLLDSTPWERVVDIIALIKEENPPASTEYHYGPPAIGPEGSRTPGHVYRCGEVWSIGPFDPASGYDTPGVPNRCEDCVLRLPISAIQGAAHRSPYVGGVVATEGIVTARSAWGFWMEAPSPDGDEATSEGLYVYIASAPDASVGDRVVVTGTVTEYYPGGYATGNLPITEISSPTVEVIAHGQPLPLTLIGEGGRLPPSEIIEDDAVGDVETSGIFDPMQDGLDFYESLEGMRVAIQGAIVVGPMNAYGEIVVVGDEGAQARLRTARGGLLLRAQDANPERILLDDALVPLPAAQVGDRFAYVIGVLGYSYGNYKLLVTEAAPLEVSNLPQEESAPRGEGWLRAATLNVENLSPTSPHLAALGEQIVHHLGAPDILGLQEVQDHSGPADDGTTEADATWQALIGAITEAGGPAYDWRDIAPLNNQDGGIPGGNIRVGFLFRPDRVTFVDRPGGDAITPVTATLGVGAPVLSASPGRIDPLNPAFANSRKPLVGEFLFLGREKVFVIAAHWISKGGDSPLFGRLQPPLLVSEPQRMAQAEAVGGFVRHLLGLDPKARIILLGDLNDLPFSAPLQALASAGLKNLLEELPLAEQYTYIYDGNSEALDYILASPSLMRRPYTVDVVHLNAEYPAAFRVTDHDAVVADFALVVHSYHLPCMRAYGVFPP